MDNVTKRSVLFIGKIDRIMRKISANCAWNRKYGDSVSRYYTDDLNSLVSLNCDYQHRGFLKIRNKPLLNCLSDLYRIISPKYFFCIQAFFRIICKSSLTHLTKPYIIFWVV